MAERAIVRTLKLSRPIHEADREIDELEFFEPTGRLFSELERVQVQNENAKRPRDIKSTSLVILEHLTKIGPEALETATFGDLKRAIEIAGEIVGKDVGEGEA